MDLKKFFHSFVPRQHIFYIKFNEAADNLTVAANLLSELVKTKDIDQRAEYARQIKEIEHNGDNISHLIYEELNKTFITPIDREDIYKLTSALDDILDMINGSAQRIMYFAPKQIDVELISLCDIMVMMSREIQEALAELKNYKKSVSIRNNCVRINAFENNADDIFRASISRLMNEEKDVVELIKKKEILETIEEATDYGEDVANIVFSILMKNS